MWPPAPCVVGVLVGTLGHPEMFVAACTPFLESEKRIHCLLTSFYCNTKYAVIRVSRICKTPVEKRIARAPDDDRLFFLA